MAASPELLSALQAALVVMNHCYSISSGAELQAIEAAITATKIALLKAGVR
jgi:hypothetical protein